MSQANGSASETTALLGSSSQNPSKPPSPETGSLHPSHSEPDHGDAGVDQGIGVARGIAIALGAGLLVLLQATNISMLTTIQSTIAGDLDAYEEASWFTTAYLVATSSLAPLMGRLSSVFSPRTVIFYACIIFAIGSVFTSLAQTFLQFIVGRAICGVGASGVFAVVVIIVVVQLASPKKRGLFIGLLNLGFTTGVSAGAIAAGGLLPIVGWRALFWLQGPLSLVAGGMLFFAIPTRFSKSKDVAQDGLSFKDKLKRLDYVGAVTMTLSITFLLIGLSAKKVLILPIIISIVLISTFVLNELYLANDPIIPVTVLKSRGVLLSCLATIGLMMCRWSVLFYTPVYSIAVRGWSPAAAGTILVPTNAGFGLGGLVVGWTHVRREGSFYLATLVTFILFPVTLAVLALATTPATPAALYFFATFCNGFCVGAAMNYSLAHVLHLTLPETHFIVASLLTTFRGFAGSFGSAIGGGVFARILGASLEAGFEREGLAGEEPLVRQLMGSPALVRQLEGLEKMVAVNGYVDALRGLFGAAAGLAAITIIVQAGVGWKGPKNKTGSEEETSNEGVAIVRDAEEVVAEGVDGVEPVPPVGEGQRTSSR